MKMRFLAATSILGALPAVAIAGPLYGTVRIDRVPAPRGVELMIQCPAFTAAGPLSGTARTDDRGSYSTRVAATGRCQIRFRSGNKLGMPFEVLVANNPLRVDFEIDANLNRVR